ncbi:hypothetical protein FrEUN1fDRAFT_7410 [Parafrankia sp. EUN1f]|nr:hypothetical protein FrEUN1fDRAFT_7410 [Parafrankia sp. EUN1f]
MSVAGEDPAEAAVKGLAAPGAAGSALPDAVLEELVAALGLGSVNATTDSATRAGGTGVAPRFGCRS